MVMRALIRTSLSALFALLAVALPLGVATAGAEPVYGPGASPGVTAKVDNGMVTVTVTGYCANDPVQFTIAPASASAAFPASVVANSTGVASITFAQPGVVYTVTASTTSAVDGCTKSASVSPSLVKSASLAPVAAAAAPAAAAGNTLPVTGSDATGMQLRNALVALGAGLGLVAVAGIRRRSTAASVRSV